MTNDAPRSDIVRAGIAALPQSVIAAALASAQDTNPRSLEGVPASELAERLAAEFYRNPRLVLDPQMDKITSHPEFIRAAKARTVELYGP